MTDPYEYGKIEFEKYTKSPLGRQHFSCPPYSDDKDRSEFWRGWRDAEEEWLNYHPHCK